MKKFKLALFLAFVLAITTTSSLAQAPGQIPIMGRPAAQTVKTTDSSTNTAIEPKTEISSEISDYFWTIISIVTYVKF